MSEQMRKEFEDWFYNDLSDAAGLYHLAWQAWQASRAALVVVMPESHNDWLDKQIVEYALDQAGVSYK